MVDLFYLKTFVAVTKTNSFRIAAERNSITQPAVSQHIRILEKKLGSVLLERRGKSVTLTATGRVFLPYAENILKQYEEAKMKVGEINNKFNGTIRIATIYSIGLYELQSTIQQFLKKYPEVNLHVEYHKNAAIYEMVSNRVIDFGFIAFPQRRNGVVSDIFVEDRLVLVQSSLQRILKGRNIPLESLNDVKFIAFSPHTPTGKTIYQFLQKKKIHPRVIQDYDNIELVKSAVILGMGCGILPRNAITRELKNKSLEIVSLKGFDLRRPLGILYPKGKIFTKSTRTFYEMLTARGPQP